MNTLVCNQCESMHVHLSVAEKLIHKNSLYRLGYSYCLQTAHFTAETPCIQHNVPSAEFRFLTWSGNGCGCCSHCGCGSCETCGSWSGTWENTVAITNEALLVAGPASPLQHFKSLGIKRPFSDVQLRFLIHSCYIKKHTCMKKSGIITVTCLTWSDCDYGNKSVCVWLQGGPR